MGPTPTLQVLSSIKSLRRRPDSLSTSLTNSLGQFFFVFNRIMSNEPQKKTWLVGLYGGLYYSVL